MLLCAQDPRGKAKDFIPGAKSAVRRNKKLRTWALSGKGPFLFRRGTDCIQNKSCQTQKPRRQMQIRVNSKCPISYRFQIDGEIISRSLLGLSRDMDRSPTSIIDHPLVHACVCFSNDTASSEMGNSPNFLQSFLKAKVRSLSLSYIN